MATVSLPKDAEFNTGNLAQGTDVRANDQALANFINAASLDNANIAASAGIVFSKLDATTVAGVSQSQTLTNKTINLSTGVMFGAMTPGQVFNLGYTYSAGTFTITSAAGTTLSSTNVGYVCIGKSGGTSAIIKVSAPYSFNDDAHASASDLTNLGFGITETEHWTSVAPFFIHFVNRSDSEANGADGNSTFCLSRNPAMRLTPGTTARISDTAAVSATDDQNTILLMGSYTESNYTALTCTPVGGITMTWSTTSDDWTVSASSAARGIGLDFFNATLNNWYTFPSGHNGPASGKYFLSNGGTAPTYGAVNRYQYKIDRDGWVEIIADFENSSGSTAGSGAVQLQMSLPYSLIQDGANEYIYRGSGMVLNTGSVSTICQVNAYASTTYAIFDYQSTITTVRSGILNSNQSATVRAISAHLRYKSFDSSI